MPLYQGFLGTFGTLLRSRKLKELRQRGEAQRLVGQLGRAQPHYTEADRALMETCWEEDGYPWLEERLAACDVALEAPVAPPEQPAAAQPRIDDFFQRASD